MKYLFTLLLLATFGMSYGQSVSYRVLKDAPEDCANLWVNLELLQFEMNMKNISAANLGLGINSIFQMKNRFGAETAFRHSYFTLGRQEHRVQFEVGGFFNFVQYKRIRNQKVVLKSSKSGNYTTTTYITPPATKLKSIGVRAGYAYNSESYEDTKKDFSGGYYKYRFGGLYAGLLFTTQVNYKLNAEKYGTRALNFVKRYYLDVLIYPMQQISERTTGIPVMNFAPGVFGGRAGIELLSPEKKKNYGGASYAKFELGYRPADGLYFMLTYGISWKTKLGGLNAYQVVREKE
ncbi:MAG: hypothetical protein J0G96_03640 [Flavobacteriia bacterium]|nr:hypothetical protein [Flavobacteriia bacterium]OJX39267.1 MAG: hypothetical protein BGO87_04590 [Flavobacteriia bacterium 40-80]